MIFAPVPDRKVVKNRLHLDFRPDDQEAEVARFLAHVARHADVGQRSDEPWMTLTDPNTPDYQFYGSALVSA